MQKSASKRFAKRLRELRIQCGWTQEQAAEACEVGYKLYQLYELGVKPNPGLLTLEKLASGFGLGLHEFFSPALPAARVTGALRKPEKTGRKSARKSSARTANKAKLPAH